MSPMVCRTCGSVLVSWEDYTCHKCHKRDAVYRPSKKEEELEEELEVEEEEVVPDKWAGRTCPHCGRVFRKVMSFAAHVRHCQVGATSNASELKPPEMNPQSPGNPGVTTERSLARGEAGVVAPAPVLAARRPEPEPAPAPPVPRQQPVRPPAKAPVVEHPQYAPGAMQIVTINMPDLFLDAVQRMVHAGQFPSRSEAIRSSLRSFLARELGLVKQIMSISTDEQGQKEKTQQPAATAAKRIDMRSIRAGWAS